MATLHEAGRGWGDGPKKCTTRLDEKELAGLEYEHHA
jgi:hypothetical protein